MDFLDIKETVKDILKYVLLIAVILFVITYLFSLQQVIGPSMDPNLQDNDILILNKLKYKYSDIKRGDVVALRFKDTNYLVKRVIGLPGDAIEFKNNKLYINGSVYDEIYLKDDVITEDFSLEDIGYRVIPEDYYFVLGDNREKSSDSRNPDLGLVSKDDILGKTILKIWPLNGIKLVK